MKKVLVALLALVAIASLAGNAFLYQRYSTSRPLLRMGDESITIKEYRDALEYQAGKPVLTELAISKMVTAAARKAGVTPTEKDVDARIAYIRRTQPTALQGSDSDPAKKAEYRQKLTTQMALENLTIKDVKLSDGEIRAFYNKNRAQFAVPMQAESLVVIATNPVDAATAKALLNKTDLTGQAIVSNTQRLGVLGINVTMEAFDKGVSPAARQRVSNAVMDAPVGVRGIKTVPLDNGAFAVLRVNRRDSAGFTRYEKAKPLAERMARIEKASKNGPVLARLYKDADIQFEIPRYAAYFAEIEQTIKASKVASAKGK
ncbi:MAG: peptidyl-prolyl cis-trans isomerase [Armatimonadota bacterium]